MVLTQTQVLSGGGGVGKSQLAASYARAAVRDRDVDLVVWVSATTSDAIMTTYAQAAAEAQIPGADGQDLEADARRFVNWLSTTPRSWLVVLDDITDPDHAANWWPPGDIGTGWVLATTRRRDEVLFGGGRQRVDVDVYDEDEATKYLSERLERAGKTHLLDDRAADLAEALGRLPLALSHAAAYMIEQRITCGAYLDLYIAGAERLDALMPADPDGHGRRPDGTTLGVTVTLLLALQAANSQSPAGIACPAMELASVLDPTGHPEALWTTEASCNYLTVYRTPALDEMSDRPDLVTPRQARAALLLLDRYGLATFDEQAGPAAVRTHALTARAARETASEAQVAAAVWAAADAVVALWPTAHDEIGRDPDLSWRLRANTAALHEHAGEHLWTTDEHHPILTEAGRSLGQAGQAAAAATYFTELHAAAAQRLGPDHPATLAARSDQVIWQVEARDVTSLHNTRQLVADLSRVLGPNRHETHNARHTLGLALGRFGDHEAAVAELESLLAARTAILGPRHPATLKLQHNLARARGEAGDLAGAIADLKKILAETEEVLGADHIETLTTRNELARFQSLAGDPAGAATMNAQLLADRERVLGPGHPHTLLTRSELATTTWLADDEPAAAIGAIAAFESLLADRLRVLGPGHPDTLETRLCLAISRTWAGPAPSTITDVETLLGDILLALGPRHPHAWQACELLASLRSATGDSPAIGPDELLAGCLRVFGADHPEILPIRMNLVAARIKTDDPAGTVSAMEGLVNDLTRLHGPDHEDTLMIRSRLALWRMNAGDLAGAIADYDQLLTDFLRILGPDHPDTVIVQTHLATAYFQAGRINEAITIEERVTRDQERLLGAEHPHTLTAWANLASSYWEAGRTGEAIPIQERVARDRERLLGADHPDTLTTKARLHGWTAGQ